MTDAGIRVVPGNLHEWYPGRRVRILGSPPIASGGARIPTGTITKMALNHSGVLVRPDGLEESFGWGFSELELEPLIIGPSAWERLEALRKERRLAYIYEHRDEIMARIAKLGPKSE
jgi:hypothetical protein